jgi:hypothetical protein
MSYFEERPWLQASCQIAHETCFFVSLFEIRTPL